MNITKYLKIYRRNNLYKYRIKIKNYIKVSLAMTALEKNCAIIQKI